MSQITLTFPDKSKRKYDSGIKPIEIAKEISSSLGKKAISALVNNNHWDLQWPIIDDSEIAINTMKGDYTDRQFINGAKNIIQIFKKR